MAVYTGTNGDDLKNGTATADTLSGGKGNDVLLGRAGDDLIVGGLGTNELYGGDGNDRLRSSNGAGADTLDGGAGIDLAEVYRVDSTEAFSVTMGAAFSQTLADGTVLTNIERLFFYAGSGSDTLTGGAYDDVLDGGSGSAVDYLYGGGGTDRLVGGAGDFLYGGSGGDVLAINGAPAILDGGSGIDRANVGGSMTFAANTVTSVEKFFISGNSFVDFSNVGYGVQIESGASGSLGYEIKGTIYNDTVYGGAGDDILNAGVGNDSVFGGAGSDTIVGGTGNDSIFGGAGDDLILSNGNRPADVIDGGEGFDRLHLELTRSTGDLNVDLTSVTPSLTGNGGSVVGIEQATLEGGSGNDRFTGGAFDDVLAGNAGDDTIFGGGGDDYISGGAGINTLDGGDGFDTARYAGQSSAYTVTYDSGSDTYNVVGTNTLGQAVNDTLTDIESLRFNNGTFAIDSFLV